MCMGAKLLQSRPTLCDHMDCSPPGSSVHGILQARVLEWDAIPSSRGLTYRSNLRLSPALAGGFFTTNATWEAPSRSMLLLLLLLLSRFSHVRLCATP